MSSVKRRKIHSLPLKVKRHIPGQKAKIVKHDLMAGTIEDYRESETGIPNAVYRAGETVNDNGKVQLDSPIENEDLTEGSQYRSRKEKCFTAWSSIIRKSLTISCKIEGHFMSSVVCCACNKNVGEIRCLDCSMESTYCESCARKIHEQWNFWTHSLEIRKVCILNANIVV
jgi:hypothetical protein